MCDAHQLIIILKYNIDNYTECFLTTVKINLQEKTIAMIKIKCLKIHPEELPFHNFNYELILDHRKNNDKITYFTNKRTTLMRYE